MAGMVAKLSIDVPPFRYGDLVQVLAQTDGTASSFDVKNHTSAGCVPDYALHFQPQLKELPPLHAVGRIASMTVDSRPFSEGDLVEVMAKREHFNMFDVRNNLGVSGCVSVSVLSFQPEGTKLPDPPADTQPQEQGAQAQVAPSMVGRIAMLRFDSRPFKGGELVQVVSRRDGTNMFEVRSNTRDGIIAGSALALQPEGTQLPEVSAPSQTSPVKPISSMEGRVARMLFDCRPFKEGTLVKVVAKKDGVNMFDVTNNDRSGCVPGSALCFEVECQDLPDASNPASSQHSPKSAAAVSPEKDGTQPNESASTPRMQSHPASTAVASPKKDGTQIHPAAPAVPNMVGRVARLVSSSGPFQKDELVQISSVDERACKFDVRSHTSKGSVPEMALALMPEGTQMPPAEEGCCAGCVIS